MSRWANAPTTSTTRCSPSSCGSFFLLYAEERDLLPAGETFPRHYSPAGLYERLREDAALHPDTMHQRYGAWAQLLVLFRLSHDGAEADGLQLSPRHGDLFNPDRFPFLEGRPAGGARQIHERVEPPLVPDGTVYRALDKLLVLDGERISYRALDDEKWAPGKSRTSIAGRTRCATRCSRGCWS